MSKKINIIFILFLVIITGCSKTQKLTAIVPVGALRVTVSPAKEVVIALYQSDVKIQQLTSDSKKGNLDIPELAAGEYTIDIQATGYQSFQRKVIVNDGEETFVEIVLTPLSLPPAEPTVTLPPTQPPIILPPDFQHQPDNKVEFIPGEIIVGFRDYVTLEEAQDIVNLFGLKGEWRDVDWQLFSFWVKVLNGDPQEYVTKLEESNIVSWAEIRSGLNNIIIQFNLRATEETARSLVSSISNLEITSINRSPKWFLVFVPKGTENDFIEKFKTHSQVKYVELNYMTHSTQQGQ